MTKDSPVLVTTAHRGVFFGYGSPTLPENKIVTLRKAKMCVYWDASLHGVLGLASAGPNKNCKIGPGVQTIQLSDVTSIVEVSNDAEKNWLKENWA